MNAKNWNEIEALHREAMDLAERADAASAAGEKLTLLRQAFERERAAVALLLATASPNPPQPSLGILYRSAATLAFECHEFAEAKALVDQALEWRDEMPADLVDELMELRDDLSSGGATARSAP